MTKNLIFYRTPNIVLSSYISYMHVYLIHRSKQIDLQVGHVFVLLIIVKDTSSYHRHIFFIKKKFFMALFVRMIHVEVLLSCYYYWIKALLLHLLIILHFTAVEGNHSDEVLLKLEPKISQVNTNMKILSYKLSRFVSDLKCKLLQEINKTVKVSRNPRG